MDIKQNPEDFFVEEAADLVLEESGDYTYFILEKRNWTTLKALEYLANKLHITVKRFSFAGQKDRKGVTRQYISVYRVPAAVLEKVALKDIHIEVVGYSSKTLGLGALRGNKFRIVARGLWKPLRKIDAVVNYYDEQRFGGYRPNMHLIGKELLLGNYERAVQLYLLYPFPSETEDYVAARQWMEKNWGDWDESRFPRYLLHEKAVIRYLKEHPGNFKNALKALPRALFTMFTHAYQSYLFNVSLSRYLEKKYKEHWKVSYALGDLVFISLYVHFSWPIVGYKSKLSGDAKDIIEELMKEEGIWYETFHCEIPMLASEGLMRDAMISVQDFSLGKLENSTQEVSFFLPKGSYATMVMKALEA